MVEHFRACINFVFLHKYTYVPGLSLNISKSMSTQKLPVVHSLHSPRSSLGNVSKHVKTLKKNGLGVGIGGGGKKG